MAEPSDVFQPQQGPDIQGAAAEWTAALNDPKVRSSLLSFGLQAMQPMAIGQTAGGHFAQAVGKAGETQDILDKEERDDREQARKEEDTRSLVGYRGDRSEVAAAMAETAQHRADSARIAAESQAKVREADVITKQMKLGLIQQQIDNLALVPQSEEVKNRLREKQAELYAAKVDVEHARAAAIPQTAATAAERLQVQRERTQQTRETAQDRNETAISALYQKDKEANDKQRFMNPRVPPIADEPTWRQQKGFAPRVARPVPGAPTTTTAPATPATPAATPAALSPEAYVKAESEALAAVARAKARGADPSAIRERFKKNTGRDLID